MIGIASAATAVVIGYVADGTRKIRVGSGGIMLPNHAPIVIAEQFGTLESLYPGRIDLGLGRAPGRISSRCAPCAGPNAPRSSLAMCSNCRRFWAICARSGRPGGAGNGHNVPFWILGSSLFGAQLAAALGLPFAFASHFAPDALCRHSKSIARASSRPSSCSGLTRWSDQCHRRRDDAEARRLFTSPSRASPICCAARAAGCRPPIDDIETYWTPAEKAQASQMLPFVRGLARDGAAGLEAFMRRPRADELIVASAIYDQRRDCGLTKCWRRSLG